LFEAVEGFVEKINPIFAIANFEVRRLLDVDFVIDVRIEKCRFEVKLINKKVKDEGDREKNANRCGFYNGCKSIGVIETRDLRVALSDDSCLKTWFRCFGVFDAENWSCADDLAIERTRNEGPCTVGIERVHLRG